jgi:hypothetical protein
MASFEFFRRGCFTPCQQEDTKQESEMAQLVAVGSLGAC